MNTEFQFGKTKIFGNKSMVIVAKQYECNQCHLIVHLKSTKLINLCNVHLSRKEGNSTNCHETIFI